MKKNLSYIILILAVLFTTNLYAQIGNIIPGGPDGRLPFEDDGTTLSWTLAGCDGEIPELATTIMLPTILSNKKFYIGGCYEKYFISPYLINNITCL